ncbi:hypothetical protein B566_EDAN015621 [Ephemera danica]|nr:hypothetical protein B566_EDAN015621 [Ephemera danica]
MHPDLSPHLHSDECNRLIKKLQTCHSENKFARFVGYCNDIDTELSRCLKAEKSKLRKIKSKTKSSAGTIMSSSNLLIDFEIPPIEESFVRPEKNLTVTERYFSPRFVLDASGIEGEDQCVLFHSNKICLVTLAPSHPVLAQHKTISKVDFQVSTNVDRSKNKVSGKGKHGAQVLQPKSLMCFIECTDGTRYVVTSCIQGKLVEINENLIDTPNLLVENPRAEGYIATILPSLIKSSKQKDELLTEEEYQEKRHTPL